ncbi:MAG: response regulator, partial [Nitriliruptor sp.]
MYTRSDARAQGITLARYAGARVVIVDDHPTNVALLDRIIRNAGLDGVHAITDPRDAVQRCLEIGADLVLLDLHMPHLDGYEVLAALRAALPPGTFLPIVVLTGDATIEARDRALTAGATDFLTKPFDHAEVVLRIHNLLETRTLYSELQEHAALLQAHLDARDEHQRR